LTSYPRSGTAWAYAVLWAVLHRGDIAALQKAQSEHRILKFQPVEVGCDASVTDRITNWRTLSSPRVIPTHLPQGRGRDQYKSLRRGERAGEQTINIFVSVHFMSRGIVVSFAAVPQARRSRARTRAPGPHSKTTCSAVTISGLHFPQSACSTRFGPLSNPFQPLH
jgi:hypothetical protein